MSPADIAATQPDKAAYIMADTGDVVTFAELEATANQGAQLFRSLGLQRGDHIAILLENHPRFFQICWAAQRSGIYFTAISWRLQQQEVGPHPEEEKDRNHPAVSIQLATTKPKQSLAIPGKAVAAIAPAVAGNPWKLGPESGHSAHQL